MTGLSWSRMLPESIAEKVRKRASEVCLSSHYPSMGDFISGAFVWLETAEGVEFWAEVAADKHTVRHLLDNVMKL
jgi:hypothetical protein